MFKYLAKSEFRPVGTAVNLIRTGLDILDLTVMATPTGEAREKITGAMIHLRQGIKEAEDLLYESILREQPGKNHG